MLSLAPVGADGVYVRSLGHAGTGELHLEDADGSVSVLAYPHSELLTDDVSGESGILDMLVDTNGWLWLNDPFGLYQLLPRNSAVEVKPWAQVKETHLPTTAGP